MYNNQMYQLGNRRSCIRELFEFGKQLSSKVGEDHVYDFSLGNPNVPAPDCVHDAINEYNSVEDNTLIHGYTSAQGDLNVRKAIAENIHKRFNVNMDCNKIYMTCGAAASLTICLNALYEENDEFIIFAPYFPEYKVFINACGGKAVTVPFNKADFQINFDYFENAINKNTKAVIINSPNNPCGVIYNENTIIKLTDILKKKSAEIGHPIILIADEPYRELVYDDISVPYLMNYYDNTLVCYSYSKSLSLPGERIGYIAVCPNMEDGDNIYLAICGAGRALGYVCAPHLFQLVAAKCVDAKPDLNAYKRNRDLLYNSLTEIGYKCVHPDGAFYLFVESLEEDANKFSDKAKQLGLLIVPGDDFAAPGYIRLSYCVSYDMIKRSIPAFKELYKMYN